MVFPGSHCILNTSCPLKNYTGRRQIIGFGYLNTILYAFKYKMSTKKIHRKTSYQMKDREFLLLHSKSYNLIGITIFSSFRCTNAFKMYLSIQILLFHILKVVFLCSFLMETLYLKQKSSLLRIRLYSSDFLRCHIYKW